MTEPNNFKLPLSNKQKENIKEVSEIGNLAEIMVNHSIPLITEKNVKSFSTDKRDFISLSPYWHRKDDGKIELIDGEVSLEVKDYPDVEKLNQISKSIFLTSYAAKFAEKKEEKKKFSDYAESVIKAWFINEETRMTPSFEFSQMKPGEMTGNFYGIIEGSSLIYVIEGLNNLRESELIDSDTLNKAKDWFSQYLNWLLISEKAIGKKNAENEREKMGEKGMPNNHSTFYDAQVLYIADLLNKSDLVKEKIEEIKIKIKNQIEPTGEMKEETKRILSYDYQIYNLCGLAEIAVLVRKYGIDLWNWKTDNNRGLSVAFEYFYDQLKKTSNNPFKMNRSFGLYYAFRAASQAYDNKSYWDLPNNFYDDKLMEEITNKIFKSNIKQKDYGKEMV